jgi:hypothetical protein
MNEHPLSDPENFDPEELDDLLPAPSPPTASRVANAALAVGVGLALFLLAALLLTGCWVTTDEVLDKVMDLPDTDTDTDGGWV